MRRAPRTGRALAAAGVLGLLVLAMPIVAELLIRFVDTSAPLDLEQARTAQAVVILGGGVRRDALEYGGDTLATLTLERVRYGARVARLTGLPVLVSGGSVLGGEPEAKLMAASLEHEFGVPVRWIEARSRTTHENAVLSAADAEERRHRPGRPRHPRLRHTACNCRIRGAGPCRRQRADGTARRLGSHDSGLRSEHGRTAAQLLRDLRDSRQPRAVRERRSPRSLSLARRAGASRRLKAGGAGAISVPCSSIPPASRPRSRTTTRVPTRPRPMAPTIPTPCCSMPIPRPWRRRSIGSRRRSPICAWKEAAAAAARAPAAPDPAS